VTIAENLAALIAGYAPRGQPAAPALPTAAYGAATTTPGGQFIPGGMQSVQPPDAAEAALNVLGAIYGAANQQAAKLPGASRVAKAGRRGSEALAGWVAAAPKGSDMQKSRRTFAKLYDFVVPQDEIGAVLAAIPPAKPLRVVRGGANLTERSLGQRVLIRARSTRGVDADELQKAVSECQADWVATRGHVLPMNPDSSYFAQHFHEWLSGRKGYSYELKDAVSNAKFEEETADYLRRHNIDPRDPKVQKELDKLRNFDWGSDAE
jgi:hypothetical protein